MGAYMSEPVTQKCSSDEANDYIDVGASSMQGWRMTQEDAHNCILSYDENTSLFAVYDGHGGAEVATYSADVLPQFLKTLKSYKDGDFEQALKDAFLGFDATLLQDDVFATLKRLAGEKNPDEYSEIEDEEEDLNELYQEGDLPLDQVLEKYKGCIKFPQMYKMKLSEETGAGTSKPLSPFLRGRQSDTSSPSSDCQEVVSPSSSSTAPQKSPTKSLLQKRKVETDPEDSVVSSSSGVAEALPAQTQNSVEGDSDSDKSVNSNVKNGTILKCSSPDSSSATSSTKIPVNSETSSSVPEGSREILNGDVVGSSSSPSPSSEHQENEVSTNSPNKKEETKGESASCSSSTSTASESSSKSSKENGVVSSYSSEVQKERSDGPLRRSHSDTGTSPNKISSSTNEEAKAGLPVLGGDEDDDEDSSSGDDMDFQADEENSSTEDGDAECESYDDEETEDEDEEAIEDDEGEGIFTNMVEEPGKDSGCTAVVALVHGRDLYVANAGDSRCVVCRNGKAIEMSIDHKPEDTEERQRIVNAGGNVTTDGRVNGGLNLSRAIGDHSYKMNKDLPPEKQMISALPDVRKLVITPEDEFMILACDGIWNCMSSDEVVDFVKKRFDEGKMKMSQICEELFTNCLAPSTLGDGTGCDNMTAVLIRLKPPLFDLPSKISVESEAIPVVQSIKRAAEECNDTKDETVANSSKRQKTDDDNQEVTTCDKVEEDDANDGGDVQMPSTTDSNTIHKNTMETKS